MRQGITILLSLSITLSFAQIIYVDHGALGSNTGDSWTNALPSFQEALELAVPGDSIYLAGGTYTPSKEREYELPLGTGRRFNTFAMVDSVKVFGGFDPISGNRNFTLHPTIFNGKLDSVSCLNIVVYINCGEGTVLDGVIIENGNANRTGVSQGNGEAIFHDCGSAIQFSSSDVVIRNTWFRNNFANMVGGASFGSLSEGDREIRYYNCIFSNNEADAGGAVQVSFSDQFFYNCIFYDNKALSGAGFGIAQGSFATVYNSIFFNNRGPIDKDIFLGPNTGNHLEISHSITQSFSQFEFRDSMYTGDPLFIDPDNGDFRLDRNSFAINLGTVAFGYSEIDFYQQARLVDSIDLGVFEFQLEDSDLDGYFNDEDCDIFNAEVNPGQEEVLYNGLDDDCNEDTLDDDLDQDGFELNEDCNDMNAEVNPNMLEIEYNGLDDDCNVLTLDDDLDQDGFELSEDCDDDNAEINPLALEIPNNGIDEDCDGMDAVSSIFEIEKVNSLWTPNPTFGKLKMNDSNLRVFKIQVYDSNGQRQPILINDNYVDISALKSGIYIIQVLAKDQSKRFVQKLIKL